jgi:hypothetical protein
MLFRLLVEGYFVYFFLSGFFFFHSVAISKRGVLFCFFFAFPQLIYLIYLARIMEMKSCFVYY